MIDQKKINEVFSDKEYVESILKMSAEDAAKSLNEKGVDVTADGLMKVRDFLLAHQDELQNGELSEEALAEVAGGADWGLIIMGISVALSALGLAIGGVCFALGISW